MKRLWLLLMTAAIAIAQTSFEVATVKIAPVLTGDLYNINLGTVEHGTVTLTNASLADCVRFAYALTSDNQLAGPDWMKSKELRYNIVAKTSADASQDQIQLMMQALLAERFHLALHRESKELSYYALTVAKTGSKLTPASDTPPAPPAGVQGQMHILSNRMPMLRVASLLSRYMRALVVDQTGLAGPFEVKLVWTPDDRPVPDDQRGPTIFTALKEQLGLALESRKGPLQILVVDRVEKTPAEN